MNTTPSMKKTPRIRLGNPDDPSQIERKRIQAEKKRAQRKRCMEKKSDEEREAYWKKEYLRTGTARKRVLQTEEGRQAYLEKDRHRKKEKKMREAEEMVVDENSSPMGSYQRNQTLGKAVARVTKSLPSSPSKQRALVASLADRIGSGEEDAKGSRAAIRFSCCTARKELLLSPRYLLYHARKG